MQYFNNSLFFFHGIIPVAIQILFIRFLIKKSNKKICKENCFHNKFKSISHFHFYMLETAMESLFIRQNLPQDCIIHRKRRGFLSELFRRNIYNFNFTIRQRTKLVEFTKNELIFCLSSLVISLIFSHSHFISVVWKLLQIIGIDCTLHFDSIQYIMLSKLAGYHSGRLSLIAMFNSRLILFRWYHGCSVMGSKHIVQCVKLRLPYL